MRKNKKFIFFTIFLLFLFSYFLSFKIVLAQSGGSVSSCSEEDKKAGTCLELTYPEIGRFAPKTKTTQLSDYFKYVFNFSVWIVGFIIVAVFVYAGFLYITSQGNPGLLSDAKERIVAALIGSLILLASYIIFNTINPQIIDQPINVPESTEVIIPAGIYLCDKFSGSDENNFNENLERYIKKNNEMKEANTGALEINKILKKNNCKVLLKSGPFEKKVSLDKYIILQIPNILTERETDSDGKISIKRNHFYIYGVILQETKDRFSGDGQCKILTYDKFNNSMISETSNLKFQSFTIFMKIVPEKDQQVDFTLYSCLNYNEGKSCKIGKEIKIKETPFSLHEGDENYLLKASPLEEGLKNNTRSIRISRPIGFVVFEGQNKCQVFFNNDRNLLDDDIGRCGGNCFFILRETEEKQVRYCVPCMEKATFIKGKIL
jgi:hypothetical protein